MPIAPTTQLRPFTPKDLAQLRVWFGDSVINRRLSTPDETWVQYITSDHVTCHTACDQNGAMAGFIQVDQDGPRDYWFQMVIAPDRQNLGFGQAALKQLCDLYRAENRSLCAAVAPDNLASLRCLANAGFVQSALPDADGCLIYRHP